MEREFFGLTTVLLDRIADITNAIKKDEHDVITLGNGTIYKIKPNSGGPYHLAEFNAKGGVVEHIVSIDSDYEDKVFDDELHCPTVKGFLKYIGIN